jgi:NTE family protein
MARVARARSPRALAPSGKRTVALALGGGGARGLAHIAMLEAFDEIGVKPAVIAGASIGAAVGAAYAAGMTGKAMRRYAIELVYDRAEVFRRLVAARAGGLADLLPTRLRNPMLLEAERFCELFLPARIPQRFDELKTPLLIPTTDFYARSEVLFEAGPLRPAIAASMAVPGLIRPVELDGRVLLDGAAVNPLPFDHLRGRADLVVAIDTSIGPTAPRGIPEPWDALFSTIQLMGQTIVAEKLKAGAPDIVISPNVGTFRLPDFLQASAILRAAEPAKAELKSRLTALLADR